MAIALFSGILLIVVLIVTWEFKRSRRDIWLSRVVNRHLAKRAPETARAVAPERPRAFDSGTRRW